MKIRERNALGWKQLNYEFRWEVLYRAALREEEDEEEDDPNGPDWEELEHSRDQVYEIALEEAIEQGERFSFCVFCQLPTRFCNC